MINLSFNKFSIQISTFCPLIEFMSFFVDFPTNGNHFSIQLQLIGFYKREGQCLLCVVSAEYLNIIQVCVILLKIHGTTKVGVRYEETSLMWMLSPSVIRGTSVRLSMSVFDRISANILCRICIKFCAVFLYAMLSSKHELHEYLRSACHILLGHKWIYTRNSQISWPISVKFDEESQTWCRWSIISFM